ncbi:MAG TPA: VCBS repeat-containing protein [Thermoanaerobaculia bacterium]|nr:VCBS repeat-containing protein [Thermoanaerobaculia bacterium]
MSPRWCLVFAPPLLVLAGCTQSPQPQPAAAPAPPAAATPTPAPKSVGKTPKPTPTAEEQRAIERFKEIQRLEDAMVGKVAESDRPPIEIVTDPKTGEKQQRIEKAPIYNAVRGRLYNAAVHGGGIPILREDDKAYYVAVPEEASPEALKTAAARQDAVSMPTIIDIPADEAEVVAPKRSASKLVFEDFSDGLPTSGMWRETFALGDLDGDGKPEIVAPPPRLSGQELRIFKLQGKRWVSITPKWDNPEQLGFEYGGVAIGDIDGDGRPDIVYGYHGGGPAVAYNLGGFNFRLETRGLPKAMSTRSLDIGDVDGDGKPDIIAISDLPEYTTARAAEAEGNAVARQRRPDGYLPGYDVRLFLQRGKAFEEVVDGLEEACFGYSIALAAAPRDNGEPFFGTACRYRGLSQVVYAYDRAKKSFHAVSNDVAEHYAYHMGAAVGTYRGSPAVYMTYFKQTPSGGSRQIGGDGISVYYREGGAWKRSRIVKSVEAPIGSAGIAVGDLNGDGLDDVAFADDSQHRIRIFFQKPDGSFEELASDLEPTYVNHGTALRIADVDGDGRKDIVLMYQFLTGDETRAGGLKVFRYVR